MFAVNEDKLDWNDSVAPAILSVLCDFEMMELIEMNAIRRRIQTMVIQSPQLADVATVGQKCNWENNDYFWEYFPVS